MSAKLNAAAVALLCILPLCLFIARLVVILLPTTITNVIVVGVWWTPVLILDDTGEFLQLEPICQHNQLIWSFAP